jgi:FtsZ-binding cell division protein ZapB
MIQKLLTFAKGSPWWAWVPVGLAVLYLFNVASGSIYSRKLWNMVHDQIVQEDKVIQEELEKEVSRLDQREKELIQENARIKQQLAAAQEEKRVLLGRLHEIETQLNAVASNLPSSLLIALGGVSGCVSGFVPPLQRTPV